MLAVNCRCFEISVSGVPVPVPCSHIRNNVGNRSRQPNRHAVPFPSCRGTSGEQKQEQAASVLTRQFRKQRFSERNPPQQARAAQPCPLARQSSAG
jgi:hypothetical protein